MVYRVLLHQHHAVLLLSSHDRGHDLQILLVRLNLTFLFFKEGIGSWIFHEKLRTEPHAV